MTDQDKVALDRELCKRWPKKLSASDLAYWHDQLDGHNIHEITSALTKFRNTSRFVPKPKEIIALLPRRISTEEKNLSELEGSFADVLRRQNPQYQGRIEIEIYCRYWRGQWIAYHSRAEQSLQSLPKDAQKHRDQIVDRAALMMASLKTKCAYSLISQAGVPRVEAERMAEFITVDIGMFRLFLNDIRQQPSAEEAEAAEEAFA